jgi:hypothetical protein
MTISTRRVDVLFCAPKEYQKSRFEKLGGGEAMKAPAGLLSRRPVCEANAACSARQGREARIKGCSPLIIPKKKALPKNRAVRQSAQTLFRFFDRADFNLP